MPVIDVRFVSCEFLDSLMRDMSGKGNTHGYKHKDFWARPRRHDSVPRRGS